MVLLINSNRMQPPVAPVGLDYLAAAAADAGIGVQIADLCLSSEPEQLLASLLRQAPCELVGISFRNVDDCFLSSGRWFLPDLARLIQRIRRLTDAPIVLGGVGFSIFPAQIVLRTEADFGIHGDGEQSLPVLIRELRGSRRFLRVPGLIWREGGDLRVNAPAWPESPGIPARRDAIDNAAYFRLGGQVGLETKRGCPRRCLYCADPLAKGPCSRLRHPAQVADEFQALLRQGIDVFHLCDSEFNLPPEHALAVCDELIRRGLGDRVRWYAYLAVVPFDTQLAQTMARAGCAGVNFTGDSASSLMLRAYRQPHRPEDLANAVRLCRSHNIRVMIDLLLGGPGETPDTLCQTIDFIKQIDPDCAGAALGVRLYPGTGMACCLPADPNAPVPAGIRRAYEGPIDLLRPTFYVSEHLGPQPARLVRQVIADDPRFFAPPPDESSSETPRADDYNYNENRLLSEAIRKGARGAYWDILRRLRDRSSACLRQDPAP